MDNQQAKALLEKFSAGKCSAEEEALLDSWFLKLKIAQGPAGINEMELAEEVDQVWTRLENKLFPKRKTFRLWPKIAAAASILLVLALGLYVYHATKRSTANSPVYAYDVSPGGNYAVLTLGDGRKVNLDQIAVGEVADLEGLKITKQKSGQLVYQLTALKKGTGNRINRIETPKGGQHLVVLQDGTKVWLNSASSLEFPERFDGHGERVVELKGEGYFEVAKDKLHPFIAKVASQQVKVLGTHFNINAYGDEPVIRTTLLEGSIRVTSASGADRMLRPNQQAVLTATGALEVSKADVELATAWKNNAFMFEGLKIQAIMRMVERWYDVKVVYEGQVPDDHFTGTVSRFDNVSELLRLLESSGGVHFRITKDKVIYVSR